MNTDHRRAPAAAGFTLIEIMVVIVILGLLATMVAQNVVDRADEARVAKAKTDTKVIADAVSLYRAQKGQLPPRLTALIEKDEHGGSYLRELGPDPWGDEYLLRPGDRSGDWQVVSFGPDRNEGGDDDICSQ